MIGVILYIALLFFGAYVLLKHDQKSFKWSLEHLTEKKTEHVFRQPSYEEWREVNHLPWKRHVEHIDKICSDPNLDYWEIESQVAWVLEQVYQSGAGK